MYRTLTTAIASAALALFASTASAVIINLDGVTNNIDNPVTLSFDPSDTVVVDVIGTADGGLYDGWSAWAFNSGCDGMTPSMCEQGWFWSFAVVLDGDPASAIPVGVPGIFEDPLDALAQAKADFPPGSLSGTGFPSLSWYTGEDDPSLGADTRGGISLRITVQGVPLPPTVALFGLGLLGLGAARAKRRAP